VRLGVVTDESSLCDFLLQQATPAQRELELPYLRFSFAAAQAADVAELCAIDREVSAWKLPRETREASAQLGLRRLKSLRTICSAPLLAELEEAVREGRARGHHVMVCGVQASVAAAPLDAALTAYFYQSMAAICAAVLKLMRIGQDGCQRALRQACEGAAGAVSGSLDVPRARAGWFNPLLEIASMRHERAEERLFIS